MKYKIGDKVKFLNDTGGGRISRIDHKYAYVEDEFGFEVPVPFSEVVPDKGFTPFEDEEDEEPVGMEEDIDEEAWVEDPLENFNVAEAVQEERTYISSTEVKILLGATSSGEETYTFYLINDSSYHLLYQVLKIKEEGAAPIKSGELSPDKKIPVLNLRQLDINEMPVYRFQFLFSKTLDFPPVKPVDETLEIKPIPFFKEGAFKENDYFNEKALIYPLVEADFKKAVSRLTAKDVQQILTEKETRAKAKKVVVHKDKMATPAIEEVDLHIEEIVDDHKGLSNKEILDIQMSRFITALEGAILSNIRKIVFIHGIGNGKLKFELRKELDKSYPHLKYQDASFKEYGYGATMVMLT